MSWLKNCDFKSHFQFNFSHVKVCVINTTQKIISWCIIFLSIYHLNYLVSSQWLYFLQWVCSLKKKKKKINSINKIGHTLHVVWCPPLSNIVKIEHQWLLEGNKDGKWKVDRRPCVWDAWKRGLVSATLRCSWLGFFSYTKWTNSVIVKLWALL